jgi:hypothetical protein
MKIEVPYHKQHQKNSLPHASRHILFAAEAHAVIQYTGRQTGSTTRSIQPGTPDVLAHI